MYDIEDKDFYNQYIAIYDQELFRFLLGFTRNAEDANDLKQDAFLKAWVKMHQLRDKTKAKTWLFSIGYNEFRMSLRKHKREKEMRIDVESFETTVEDIESGEDSVLDMLVTEINVQTAMDALKLLDDRSRTWIEMHYIEGIAPIEIAEIMQMNRSTVRSNICRSAAKFRTIYKKLEKEGF